MASGTDDFTAPIPLQGRKIDVYECVEERSKGVEGVRECMFSGKGASEYKKVQEYVTHSSHAATCKTYICVKHTKHVLDVIVHKYANASCDWTDGQTDMEACV